MKPVVWVGDSLERLRSFPPSARQVAGYQLERVQAGLEPSDWKPMAGVGLGVKEIRVRAGGAFRVMYVEVARDRFRALVMERKAS